MPFRGLKSACPFEAYNIFPSTHLLIPPKMHVSKMNTFIEHIQSSPHMGEFLNYMCEPNLSPSPKHLFPPKGEWCFTPISQTHNMKTKKDQEIFTQIFSHTTHKQDLSHTNPNAIHPSLIMKRRTPYLFHMQKWITSWIMGTNLPPSKGNEKNGCYRAPSLSFIP